MFSQIKLTGVGLRLLTAGLVFGLALVGAATGAAFHRHHNSHRLIHGALKPSGTATFFCTDGEQTYRVPHATALDITAVGAPGGGGLATVSNDFAGGGNGANVSATVPVSALPAHTHKLYVEVGCAGAHDGSTAFNGGGTAAADEGGGGGGASDVRSTSISTVPNSSLTTTNDSRLVVAGGGGGAGACTDGTNPALDGGVAGDTTASGPGAGGTGAGNVIADCTQATAGGNAGSGGSTGGAGGAGETCASPPSGFCFSFNGFDGALGQGGSVDLADDNSNFGGGGGGGYYGGGGGGDGGFAGGGGGAGSSFWIGAATSTSMSEDTTGTPEVTITPIK